MRRVYASVQNGQVLADSQQSKANQELTSDLTALLFQQILVTVSFFEAARQLHAAQSFLCLQ